MRDPERQNRYGNKFDVSFPDFPSFTQRPQNITIHQKMGNHDVLEIYYNMNSSNYLTSLTTGVAVEVTWSNDVTESTFLGYVADLRFPTVQVIEKFLKITCVGASYPLKDGKSKIWKNVTASEVASELAESVGLIPKVTPSSVRYGQLSLTGESMWEKLQELAQRTGYGCQVFNAELHFHPIDIMINQFLTTMPVMAFLNPEISPLNALESPTLTFFEPTQGDYIESNINARSTKILSGIDPITGKVHKVTSSPNAIGEKLRANTKDPLFSSVNTSVVITDDVMGQNLADAKAQLSRLSIPASGNGQGDPRIFPWATIEVRNTGNTSDGFWVITEATHSIGLDGKYTVDFKCATDGIGLNQPSATRPSVAGSVPTVDLSQAITTGATNASSYRLTNTAPMVNQTTTGYSVVPRRWVGVL
jgi:hypothetical protein